MIQTYVTTKKTMKQAWDASGLRHAITVIAAPAMLVTGIKTTSKDGYDAVQIGVGVKSGKHVAKPQSAIYQNAKLPHMPRFTRELDNQGEAYTVGSSIAQPFVVGDIVNVQGVTKGKGFAGVVKRYGFSGGPKTHGQSDRLRAPGSIGQGTDPGRVHRGKRMAGHMGHATKTIRNLMVVNVDEAKQELWLSGPIPGIKNSLITLKKVGHNDKFKGLDLPTTSEAPTVEPVTSNVEENQV